jgi:2-polyprenyl-6-methoxyphenol hydroxylase-like FAD-dependent oxidoreductase
MEVLRDAQLEEVLKPVSADSSHMEHTSWLHSLSGEEYGRLWAWGNRPDRKGEYEMASPCVMSDLPQSLLEPILVEQATKLGAEFRFHTEFVSQEQLEDGHVRTIVRHRGTDTTYNVTSKYLVGADGARSAVITSVGIPIDGKQLNSAFNVHIEADLTKFIDHRPGSLNWILNPDSPDWSAVGNFRMVRPWTEFVVSMHPSLRDGKVFEPTEQQILDRLRIMIGDDKFPIKILSSFRWTINDQVARTWQKGSVFCIGDAVHRHPPINGLGSNTCISDAFNLAWKLAYVLKGLAAPSVLDSLTLERKPVGDWVVRRANTGMLQHRDLWKLMGITKEERDTCTSLMQQPTIEGAEMRKKIQDALEAMDEELNALGIQMNQVYVRSPLTVVEDGDEAPDFEAVDKVRHMTISTFPGYHLPHVWVAKDGQSRRTSSLDLAGRGEFTLFTGIGGGAWKEAAAAVSAEGTAKVRAYSIGFRQDYLDAYRDWARIRGVDEDGCVLVRPDHFVAWRCKSITADPKAKLVGVLQKLLGWQ